MRAFPGALLATPGSGPGLPASRIAVPFWNGILSALGATAISVLATIVAMVVLLFAVVLATGKMPSLNPGHPLVAASELIFYAGGGCFAAWRLRRIGRWPFRPFTAGDVRTILIGLGFLILVRIGTAVQLALTDQTKHVQKGFEHFDVVTTQPTLTTIAVAIAVVTMVFLGPVVEEIVFRGLLFGALARPIGIVPSALVSSLLFAAIHGEAVLFPSLAALGLVAAFSYAATGNLWVPIVLHAANNALGAAFLIGGALHHAR